MYRYNFFLNKMCVVIQGLIKILDVQRMHQWLFYQYTVLLHLIIFEAYNTFQFPLTVRTWSYFYSHEAVGTHINNEFGAFWTRNLNFFFSPTQHGRWRKTIVWTYYHWIHNEPLVFCCWKFPRSFITLLWCLLVTGVLVNLSNS